MKLLKQASIGILSTGLLLGCGNSSTKIVGKGRDVKDQVSQKPKDVQTFMPKVDILFVIDSSYSMDVAQANLSANAALFSTEIAKMSLLDFHIGVITTDMESRQESGRLHRNLDRNEPAVLEKNTPDLAEILAARMLVGTAGSGEEKMYAPVVSALSFPLEGGENKGFYRQDAYLAVIFVTDAKEQSSMTTANFLSFLVKKKGDMSKVLGYGVIRSLLSARSCPTGEDWSSKLEDFLDLLVTGGVGQRNILSLCEENYGAKLVEFAKDIVNRSAGRIRLTRIPDPTTISVTYGTQVIPNSQTDGWVYENSTNSILLSPNIIWTAQPGADGLAVDFKAYDADPNNDENK